MGKPVVEAFARIAELAVAIGASKIGELPGCWELQIDERWWIAVNGFTEDRKSSHGQDVPPFHAAIEFNGWPAGLISPAGGIIAAGEAANENTFIAALIAATEKANA